MHTAIYLLQIETRDFPWPCLSLSTRGYASGSTAFTTGPLDHWNAMAGA